MMLTYSEALQFVSSKACIHSESSIGLVNLCCIQNALGTSRNRKCRVNRVPSKDQLRSQMLTKNGEPPEGSLWSIADADMELVTINYVLDRESYK
jgi:hypothetical protein